MLHKKRLLASQLACALMCAGTAQAIPSIVSIGPVKINVGDIRQTFFRATVQCPRRVVDIRTAGGRPMLDYGFFKLDLGKGIFATLAASKNVDSQGPAVPKWVKKFTKSRKPTHEEWERYTVQRAQLKAQLAPSLFGTSILLPASICAPAVGRTTIQSLLAAHPALCVDGGISL